MVERLCFRKVAAPVIYEELVCTKQPYGSLAEYQASSAATSGFSWTKVRFIRSMCLVLVIKVIKRDCSRPGVGSNYLL